MATEKPAEEVAEVDPLAVRECPKCGGGVEHGYGMYGGGIGVYVYCVEDSPCDYFYKQQDSEER